MTQTLMKPLKKNLLLFLNIKTGTALLFIWFLIFSNSINAADEKKASNTDEKKTVKTDEKKGVGTVISVVGTVKAKGSDNTERELKRGDSFFATDVISVPKEAKIQLKFTDGSRTNLISSTEYRVDSYVYKDPNKKSEYIATLTKGGFKAISGSIAKENPTGTKIRTPVATIGLRGTRYEAIYSESTQKLSSGCDKGTITVGNDLGAIEIGPESATQFATVLENEIPEASMEPPADLAAADFSVEGGEPLDNAQEGTGEEAEATGAEESEGEATSEEAEEGEGTEESEEELSEESEEESTDEEESTGEEEESTDEETTDEEESTGDEESVNEMESEEGTTDEDAGEEGATEEGAGEEGTAEESSAGEAASEAAGEAAEVGGESESFDTGSEGGSSEGDSDGGGGGEE